jgi:glycosyltransferase involved in cell wall biosynthesis
MDRRRLDRALGRTLRSLPSLIGKARIDEAGLPELPLAGKRIVLVHPAWHSCGSHKVFVSQARAYKSLGATVTSLALADQPGATPGSRWHRTYAAATQDLEADQRWFSGMPWHRVLDPGFLGAGRRWLHGNFAEILVATTKRATLPAHRTSPDLVHCNHFFCMPAALRLAGGAPVLLDTHDLQARQYDLRNRAGWSVPPVARYDDMLAIELDALRGADLLVHLNNEEAATFRALLPGRSHALLYPAVEPIEPGPGGPDFVVVASANYANFLGLAWFLTEVLPRVPELPVRIYGNVDQEFRMRAPRLLARHASLFRGRVADLAAAYGTAAAVLLPTTEGHGISIKMIEALSSGAPLIATPAAFRGVDFDPAGLGNVTLAADAASFANALREAAAGAVPQGSRTTSDTRRLYAKLFAFEPFRLGLLSLVAPLLGRVVPCAAAGRGLI